MAQTTPTSYGLTINDPGHYWPYFNIRIDRLNLKGNQKFATQHMMLIYRNKSLNILNILVRKYN